jgi:2-polyprenyl-3-methyl-5-hydroxy-6-metoxy-1,4-benzoquinol methylase
LDEFHRYLSVLSDLGALPAKGSRMLDFGCGRGELIRQASAAGYEAHGCDFASEVDGDQTDIAGLFLRSSSTLP